METVHLVHVFLFLDIALNQLYCLQRFNCCAKRVRRREAKQILFRNVSAYADHLFQVPSTLWTSYYQLSVHMVDFVHYYLVFVRFGSCCLTNKDSETLDAQILNGLVLCFSTQKKGKFWTDFPWILQNSLYHFFFFFLRGGVLASLFVWEYVITMLHWQTLRI